MYRCWITRVIELFPGGKQEIVMLSFRSLGEGCSRWSNHSIEHQGHHFLLRMDSFVVNVHHHLSAFMPLQSYCTSLEREVHELS